MKRVGNAILLAITALVFVLLLGPMAVVIVTAFSPGDYFAFPPHGLSLRWFADFFSRNELRGSAWLSLGLALGSSLAAVVLGTLAALATARNGRRVGRLFESFYMAPLVFPTLILGLALLVCYRFVGMPVLPGLALAHVIVGMPYCYRAIYASLQSVDASLEEAGQSLRATPLQCFLLVTLPLIWPGVLSGWLFAFIVSFGELNASLFLTGPGVTTLPIEILSFLQFDGSQLVIAAASALQIVMILAIVLVMERVVGIARPRVPEPAA
jgi:putative spermidine/putrescine transport system permease protein